MEQSRVLGLFKFGQRAHIDDLVRGTLYMNSLQYFVETEASNPDDLRCDSFEGVGRLIQADGGTLSMKIQNAFQPVARIRGAIQWRPTDGIKANIFCMYALREPTGPQFVDPLNFRFGDTFAVFTDGDEFFRRVRTAAEAAGLNVECHLVEYINEGKHQGEMGIFRKRLRFSYQSELRIAIVPGTAGPYRLYVGDLSDITRTGPLPDLNSLLRLNPPATSHKAPDEKGSEAAEFVG
ncbi:conserved hypothetical protein [Candidatus Sulfopaludibacter sp. SbA3]|nr:conserved hypothetical protein [Candidatus Sulfopaludibacter sp. SbA3]